MNFINQLLRNLKKRNVYSSFRDNIQGVDLADMQSLSICNKETKYLLCAIDLFIKYAWVVRIVSIVLLEVSIVDAFKKIISEGNEGESKGQKKQIKYGLIKVILLEIF